jgi:hypothetical protein
MLSLHSYKKLLLVLILVLVNFNLQAQLVPETSDNLPSNNLQAQIDQLQDQLDYLRQNLPRPSIRSAPQSYSQPPHKAMAGTAGCLDCGDSSSESRYLERESDPLTCLKKENDKLPSTSTKPVTFTQHKFTEDFTVDLFTNLQVDYFTGHALELFNRNSYDDYMFTQGALDFGIDIAKIAGPSHHELFFDIRAKGLFGNSGIFNGTVPRPIKIGLGRTENSYSFQPALQNLWLRELWFKYNINPQYHTDLQIGFFPYAIGSGLTLGNGYKVGKLIPGYYEERFVDQFRPGIMLTGDIWPEKLKYKIYAGLRANCSSNFYDTAQFTYSQDPNWRSKPERGSFFNNTVGAFEIEYHSERKNIQTDVRPFIIINQEDFQQVEFPGDASSTLGILGINLAAKKDRWSFFFESALNFGSQNVKAWDRDFVEFISNPTHMYLFQDFNTSTAYNPCWKQAIRTPCPEGIGYNKYNGQQFIDSNGIRFKNAFDRYRQAYQNSYHGLMFYTETAYHKLHPTKPGVQTTFAMSAGYASGDENPNDSFEKLMANRLYGECGDEDLFTCTGFTGMKDYNKPYQGFVGVDQMFMNRDVYSVFMLEAQKLNRPLATSESRLTYPLFTNLAFLGLGAKYDQIVGQERAFTFRFNALTYWQAEPTNKGYNYGLDILFALGSCGSVATNCFTPQLKADACKTMSQHLGSEINCAINYQFDQNLNFYCSGAAFIPGSYYRDIAGKIIPLEVQYQLASVDYSGYEMNKQKYDIALDNSTALIFNIGFGYSFDTAPKQRAVFSKELQANLATLTHGHVMKSDQLTLKPTNTQVTMITPITENSPRLSAAELQLLEPLEYQAITIKPIALTRTASLNNQTINTPNAPVPSTYTLPKANSLRYQTPATQPVTLVTAPTINVLELPTVSATNLTVNLAPVTKLKYQKPVTHKTKLVTTKPTATAIATPITENSPRLSNAELQLLKPLEYQAITIKPVTLTRANNSCMQAFNTPVIHTPNTQKLPDLSSLRYQKPVIKPMALTRAANLNNQTIKTPNATAPSTYALPKANIFRYQVSIATKPATLTIFKSHTQIITPKVSALNTQVLPKINSLRYQAPIIKPVTLVTTPTNSIINHMLELPTVTIPNLTVNLTPVANLKYQTPVAHKTKLVITKPTATQVIAPITENSPRLSRAELELLESLRYQAVTTKPVALTRPNNSCIQAIQTPEVTAPKTRALSKNSVLVHQTPVFTKASSGFAQTRATSTKLTVAQSHAPIKTPEIIFQKVTIAPELELFEYQVSNTAKTYLTKFTNSHEKTVNLDLPEINLLELEIYKPTTKPTQSQTKTKIKNKLNATTKSNHTEQPLAEIDPSLLSYEITLATKPVTLTTNFTKENLNLPNPHTPKASYQKPELLNLRSARSNSLMALNLTPQAQSIHLPVVEINSHHKNLGQLVTQLDIFEYQVPKTKITSSKLTIARSHAPIKTPEVILQKIATAQELELFEYQFPAGKPSKLATANNSHTRAAKLNLPDATMPELATALELEIFEYQEAEVTKPYLTITREQSPTYKFVLPKITTIEPEILLELALIEYQPATVNSAILTTNSQTQIFDLPEINLQTLELPKPTAIASSKPTKTTPVKLTAVKPATTVRRHRSNTDFEDSSLDKQELELLENYKKNFAI